MEGADYKYKYDNLRYDYNTLLILLQRDGRLEEAVGGVGRPRTGHRELFGGGASIGGLYEKSIRPDGTACRAVRPAEALR